MRFSCEAFLPVSVDTAFAFVTDPGNWPLFIPGIESAEAVADWEAPGGTAQADGRFLGRPIRAQVLILEWEPPVRFRYRMRRPGRVDFDSIRVLMEAAGRTQLTGATELAPRPGLRGLLDRLDASVLDRRTGQSMRNLTEVLERRREMR